MPIPKLGPYLAPVARPLLENATNSTTFNCLNVFTMKAHFYCEPPFTKGTRGLAPAARLARRSRRMPIPKLGPYLAPVARPLLENATNSTTFNCLNVFTLRATMDMIYTFVRPTTH